MLVLNNITFEFGARALFKDMFWHIKPGEHIGLVGPNGTGKSTLLRVIAGEYSVNAGQVSRRSGVTIGFLNQDHLSYQTEKNILEVAMEAFAEQNKLQEEIEELLEKMNTDHSEELLHVLHDKQTLFQALDGYNMQYKAEEVLAGLGFSAKDLQRPLKEFSGGWRMRVMLARILLQNPGLLLLDEPTNHLDLPSIEWLENYLKEYEGTFIVVSHDRYFLDRLVTTTAEVDQQTITLYTGNYSSYLTQKADRNELQKSRFKNQQKYIKEQEKLIDRFRAKASKASMAQSRVKMLDRLEKIDDVEENNNSIRINFAIPVHSGKVVAELDAKSKSFPGLPLLENSFARIERGDKIALIGANGLGKSTLLRMINGNEPFDGTCTDGHNVIRSFYAQHQLEALNPANEILDEMRSCAPGEEDTRLRSVLGAFLFSGDDAFKKIKVLSGGEKARVALAKTVLSNANFLLLDEPTNHLDMRSVNVLIQVLQQYEGTFVVVSHDRFFLEKVANKVWYIEQRQLKEYPGTFEEYEEWLRQRKASAETKSVKAKPVEKKENKPARFDEATREQKKLEAKIKQLESEMTRMEEAKKSLGQKMLDPAVTSDHQQLLKFGEEYALIDLKLSDISKEWEKVYEQMGKM